MSCDIAKISMCFWCGGGKEELAILADKALVREKEAWCKSKSMSVVTNYEPCNECKKEFDKGTHIIEVSDVPLAKTQPPIQGKLYPTHNMWVVDRETAKDIFENDSSTVLLDKETAEAIGLYKVEPNTK